MWKTVTLTGSIVLAGIAGIAGYETWRVARAQRIVIEVFQPFAQDTPTLHWSDLSAWQQQALLAVEDPAFFDHKGVDFTTPGAGRTTITQAVVKKLFFEHFQAGFAKIEQSLIARYVVYPTISREVQLNAFLNVVYLGRGADGPVFGFANGARVFFGKQPKALTSDEFLRLVGALVAPRDLPPVAGLPASDQRLARIKRLLAGQCRPAGHNDVWLTGCAQPS